jgi:hypothetical protein
LSETACLESIAVVEVRDGRGNLKRSVTTKKPIIRMMKRIQIFDKDGHVKSDTSELPSHSYTKQFLQILESKMRGSSSVQGKQTSGTVAGIPDSTYNGLTDMMRCDAQQDDGTYGVVVGTGTGAESNTDYKLGTQIATGQGAGQLVYGPVSHVAPAVNGSYVDYVITRSYYNGSGDDITVYEFGVYVKVGAPTAKIYCIIRDLEAGGKTVVAGDTMTVQYTLRVGAGFTIQFFLFLYSMFRCISVSGYDTGHTSRLLIFSEWEHGGGIYADNAQLFLVAGPWDNWYFYYQNTQNFGIMVGDGDQEGGADPESLSDYKLQHKITGLTYLGTNWVTTTEVAGNDDLVLSRGFYNGTEDPIDVIEVGLAWISLYGHSYGDQAYYLILRDVLAGAVTVDPGDTATVQYTLRTNVAV